MNPHYLRAVHLKDLGRYQEALEECALALAEEPDQAYNYAQLGETLSAAGRQAEALAAIQHAVSLAPNDPYVHYCWANILRRGDQFLEAEAPLRRAQELDPQNPGLWAFAADLARCQHQWQRSHDFALRALALNPNHGTSLNLLAKAFLELKQPDKAIGACRQALARYPESPRTHELLGWALLARHEYANAMKHFQIAIRLDPAVPLPKAGLVECLKCRHPLYGPILRLQSAVPGTWFPVTFGARVMVFGGAAAVMLLALYVNMSPSSPRLAMALGWGAGLLALWLIEAEACYVLSVGRNELGQHLVTPLARSVALQQVLGLGTVLLLISAGWWTGYTLCYSLSLLGGVGIAVTLHARNCAPRWPRRVAGLLAALCWAVGIVLIWWIRNIVPGRADNVTGGAWLAATASFLVTFLPWQLVVRLARWYPADRE